MDFILPLLASESIMFKEGGSAYKMLSPSFLKVGSKTSETTSIRNTLLLLPSMHLNRVSTVTCRSIPLNLKTTTENEFQSSIQVTNKK